MDSNLVMPIWGAHWIYWSYSDFAIMALGTDSPWLPGSPRDLSSNMSAQPEQKKNNTSKTCLFWFYRPRWRQPSGWSGTSRRICPQCQIGGATSNRTCRRSTATRWRRLPAASWLFAALYTRYIPFSVFRCPNFAIECKKHCVLI